MVERVPDLIAPPVSVRPDLITWRCEVAPRALLVPASACTERSSLITGSFTTSALKTLARNLAAGHLM
jgi:hypothetical protein